ncbi:hypothetical protein BDW66DRAFT_153623 [Aspergillus desertorum]
MDPRPTYVGSNDYEDNKIPRYSDCCGCPKRHKAVRASGHPGRSAYDEYHEADEYSACDWDARHCPSPRGHADRDSHQPFGEHSSRSRGRDDIDDDVLYYAKYRNPAKDLPVERDPEGIDMSKVRQHTRPGRPRESSGYCESYKVQVDEYEDDLPPSSQTGCGESAHSAMSYRCYTDDMEPIELPPSPALRGHSRSSLLTEDVVYETREPRQYRSSRAARGGRFYQTHRSIEAHVEERGPRESEVIDRGRHPSYEFTDMLPYMFSKFNIKTDW